MLAFGEESIVSEAVESRREHVDETAADELVGVSFVRHPGRLCAPCGRWVSTAPQVWSTEV